MGQIGTGKKIKELLPVKINLNKGTKSYESPIIAQMEIQKSEIEVHEAKFQDAKIDPNKKNYDPNDVFKVKLVSGGYGHTAAVTGQYILEFVYKHLFFRFRKRRIVYLGIECERTIRSGG